MDRMCGIAGIIGPQGFGKAGMRRMLDALRHRGPDEEGIYEDPAALLGQRRLSIIDLSGGRQPIPNEDQSIWIVCNGEVYNYQELRKDLESRGHRFSTRSDTEIILHLYEEVGEGCLDRLRGMFAFAIWDENRRELFAARDHLGQKPFFYVHRGDQLLFASEIKALLALDPSLREMDLEAFDQYLTLRIIASPKSMFKEVRKLPPAHFLRFPAGGQLKVSGYWNLDYEPKHCGTEGELVDELEERLVECLKLHMVSDVPVGAFMSGGLDSTLLVALLMKRVNAGSLKTFTIGLPYREFDEAPFARMVAEKYGTTHVERVVSPSLVPLLVDLVTHLDEPSDPLSICSFLISKLAREEVKVVLGGDGGDELFGGYDRYYGNRYAGYYAMIPDALRRHALTWMVDRLPAGQWYKSYTHQLKWIHQMSFLEGGARYARSLSYFYFNPSLKEKLYGARLRTAVVSFEAEAAIRTPYEMAHAIDSIDRMLSADSQVRLPDHSVMILDRMSMAHGLEARSPFMDHKIAEYAARLPVCLKVRGRGLRYIQRKLAERYLPLEVLARPKQGFSSALPYMLKGEFNFLFDLYLRDACLARDGILNQAAISQTLSEHVKGLRDHGNRLWLLLNAEIWYRLFIDGQSPAIMKAEMLETAASWPEFDAGRLAASAI
jgi:asparagine synthase (glutamine-hydrolysing)